MQINLSFNSLAELHEFVRDYTLRERAMTQHVNVGVPVIVRDDTRPVTADFIAAVKEARDVWLMENEPADGTDAVTPFDCFLYDTRPVTAEGAVIPDEAPATSTQEDSQEPTNAAAGEASSPAPVAKEAPKRKRRTKAQIAADEAAAKLAAEVPEHPADPLANLQPETEPTDEFGQPLARAESAGDEPPVIEPEIAALAGTIDGADKLAHMNEGREFISKHGFPKYNETFALVDVPSNIAGHTPEQAALHRAAMQWLGAKEGAK